MLAAAASRGANSTSKRDAAATPRALPVATILPMAIPVLVLIPVLALQPITVIARVGDLKAYGPVSSNV